jgi:hypothetical protein
MLVSHALGKHLKTFLPGQITELETFAIRSKKIKNINSLTFLLTILTILLVGTFYNFSTAFLPIHQQCFFTYPVLKF